MAATVPASCSADAKGSLRLYGQANKRTRWMPRQLEAMKDVVVCDKLGEADEQAIYPEISEWGNPVS